MRTKIVTAVCIILFFAMVQPTEEPDMWIVSLMTLAAYEAIVWSTRADRAARKAQRVAQHARRAKKAHRQCRQAA